jgi:SagB-type dehydrogenase family enzyme
VFKLLYYALIVSIAVSYGAAAMENERRIALPKIEAGNEVSVDRAIRQRRSIRDFRSDAITLRDLSRLLWSAQGITGRRGLRAAPSAGALYPLELYVVAGDVDNLPPGVYRYHPRNHYLMPIGSGDRRKPLARAALGQGWVRRAPAVLILAGVYDRTTGKYGQRGRRYVHMEAGHAAQNVYLQAESLGLGTVMVGAFDDAEVQEALDLPIEHEPLALMPVGHRR